MVAEKGDSIKRCCLTRQEFARAELVRFVVSPDGSLVPDLGARLPGRGAWVSAGALAKDGQALGQALKRALKLAQAQELCGETLIQMTRAGLEERVLAGLGLARRSGLIVVGEHQVRAVAQERGAQLRILLQATDGSADGLDKVARLVRNRAPDCLSAQVFSAERQGQAVGRESIVHLAVFIAPVSRKYRANDTGEHGLTRRLASDLGRLLLIVSAQAGCKRERKCLIPSLTKRRRKKPPQSRQKQKLPMHPPMHLKLRARAGDSNFREDPRRANYPIV